MRHPGHQDDAIRKRTGRNSRAADTCGLGLGQKAGSRVGVRCRGRGISKPAQADRQGSGRAGPPHLHLRRPARLKAAPAPIQIPALPCLRNPTPPCGLRMPTPDPAGVVGGAYAGRGGLTPPLPGCSVAKPVLGQRERPCLSLPFPAAVVKFKKKKNGYPATRNNNRNHRHQL